MISYDSYRVFYYVSKCRSFTQAARQLLTSQPNITRTIRNLESVLGCTLFLRSNHGVSLTPEGARLYEHVAAAVTSSSGACTGAATTARSASPSFTTCTAFCAVRFCTRR